MCCETLNKSDVFWCQRGGIAASQLPFHAAFLKISELSIPAAGAGSLWQKAAVNRQSADREGGVQMFGSCCIPPSAPLAPAPLKHHTLMERSWPSCELCSGWHRRRDFRWPSHGGTASPPKTLFFFHYAESGVLEALSLGCFRVFSLPGDFYDNKIRLQWHSEGGCQTA